MWAWLGLSLGPWGTKDQTGPDFQTLSLMKAYEGLLAICQSRARAGERDLEYIETDDGELSDEEASFFAG